MTDEEIHALAQRTERARAVQLAKQRAALAPAEAQAARHTEPLEMDVFPRYRWAATPTPMRDLAENRRHPER